MRLKFRSMPHLISPVRMLYQYHEKIEEIELKYAISTQYKVIFSHLAVLKDKKVPTPIEDAVENMKVLEAIIQSADKENWCMP